ncbi:hypothetical protein WA577_006642, partial [Blastocystis sp. JDR]
MNLTAIRNEIKHILFDTLSLQDLTLTRVETILSEKMGLPKEDFIPYRQYITSTVREEMQKLSRINAACFQEALSCGVDAGSIRSIEPTTPFILFCIDVFHQSILHLAPKGSLERCQEEWYSLPLDTRKAYAARLSDAHLEYLQGTAEDEFRSIDKRRHMFFSVSSPAVSDVSSARPLTEFQLQALRSLSQVSQTMNQNMDVPYGTAVNNLQTPSKEAPSKRAKLAITRNHAPSAYNLFLHHRMLEERKKNP